MSARRSRKGFPVRKVLEDTLQEDSDDDDSDEDKFLNLNEEDGQIVEPCEDVPFLTILAVFSEDVWDEDSAYLELLAKEVNSLSHSILAPVFTYLIRVLVCAKSLKN
jgi:hypothetical protein